MFLLGKGIRKMKTLRTSESSTKKLNGPCVSFSFLVLLFLPVNHVSHRMLFLFALLPLHMHTWVRHISLNFLPVGFQHAVSRTT